jgi:FAS-associated factor 2
MVMEEERRLRLEQDAEFQATLLADQAREIERQQLVDRQRKVQEDMEEAARIQEAIDSSRIDNAFAIMSSRAGQEPPPSSSSTDNNTTRLRFTLPNGKKLDRRFYSTLATVGTLRAYLIVHFHECNIEMKNFGLSTNFPRRVYSEDDDGLTLIDAGLSPQAVIMVQDLDS